MKTAVELYPEYTKEKEPFYGPSDYAQIIKEIGDVILKIDDDDYQGDSRILFKDDYRFGYLHFGWGSCSGCDALQACETMKDIQDLIDELVNQIIWFDDRESVLVYFQTHDWAGDYDRSDNQKMFITIVITLFSADRRR